MMTWKKRSSKKSRKKKRKHQNQLTRVPRRLKDLEAKEAKVELREIQPSANNSKHHHQHFVLLGASQAIRALQKFPSF